MLKNYFITALRNLIKNKIFSIINILGLSIGIAACLLILFYVKYEKGFDRHVTDIDNLYRVTYQRVTETGENVQFASASPTVGPAITAKFPEIEKFARAYKLEGTLSINEISFREENMFWAEPAFLDLFSFQVIQKTNDSLLSEPNTMVISQEMAKKYFGDTNPLDKILILDGKGQFKVVGIFKPLPSNTHFKANFLLSYINWENQLGENVKTFGWIYSGFYTYVKTSGKTDLDNLNKKIEEYINQELGEFMQVYKIKINYKLQPVKDIHLTSKFMHELSANGNRSSVTFLTIIAWFIILIAWINFVNLLTISSIKRNAEIGLRKVLGGSKHQLIRQFLFESLLINLASFLVAFAIIEICRPFFSNITGIPMGYIRYNTIWFWKYALLIFMVGTFLAGSYPVWGILTNKIIYSIKKRYTGSKRAIVLRKALVSFQFFIAVLLIGGTISVYKQLQFLHSKETGIDKSDIFVLYTPRIGGNDILSKRESFSEEVSKLPFVKSIAFSSVIPGKLNMFNRGGIYRFGDDPTTGKNYRVTEVDYSFTDVYSNVFIYGRNFSKENQSDLTSVIINLAAMNLLGYENPETAVGAKIVMEGQEATIIGVIENFHQESPRNEFEPQIFRLAKRFHGYYSIKLAKSANTKDVQSSIEKYYLQFFPGNPFEYFYLEDYYKQQYTSENRFGKVFAVFSFLALFITLLGILSLSSFSANQRRKEISIRKVMGASVNQILFLLSSSYSILLIIAFVFSVPVMNYALEKWLTNFANRMEISIWVYFIPMLLVAVFSLVTVIYQSYKIAQENPADSLRYE